MAAGREWDRGPGRPSPERPVHRLPGIPSSFQVVFLDFLNVLRVTLRFHEETGGPRKSQEVLGSYYREFVGTTMN